MEKFHLGTILSVTTGKYVTPEGLGAIYEFSSYMTGEGVYSHQLGRAEKECRPYLFKQLPFLEEISGEEVNRENWRAWLDELIRTHGRMHPVKPLGAGAHEVRDPRRELEEMAGEDSEVVSISREDDSHQLN